MKRLTLAAVAVGFALSGTALRAQEAGALLDLLVKKHIINDQEAEEVRAELVKESASTAAGKWKLSTPITEIELYGDARLRWEYRGGRLPDHDQFGQDHTNDWYERKRNRYRLRLGLRGTLADDWFFGLQLETNSNPRSANITFGDDSQVNGPFSKDSDVVRVGRVYLGYSGFPDFKFTGGKMANPFITTSMVWDDDINPEGLAEQWKHTFTFDIGGGGGEAAAVQSYSKGGYSKDGKTMVAAQAAEPFKLKLDLFVNTAQFVYDDQNPENPIGPRPTTTQPITGKTQLTPIADAYMFGWQAGGRLTFPNGVYVQLAPTLYNYTGNGDSFNVHFSGDPGGNQTGIDSLLVFDLPAEIGWKLWDIPMRVFGDFADNIDGHDRAKSAGHADHTGQHYAWMAGAAIGQLKAKHDWELRAWYQHVDQYALDVNLVDSDIYDSRVNEKGVAVKAGYMLADSIVFNLTWAYAWRVNGSLGTGGIGDIPINPLDQYQIFQADMSVKF